MLFWAVPLGLLVGVALGGLGGGGSILTVPALVYLLGQDAAAAITGSLVIVGASSIMGVIPHWRAGHVRVAQGLIFGSLGIAGSYVGTKLSVLVPSDVLLTAFAALMLAVALLMWRRRAAAGGTNHVANPPGGRTHLTVGAVTRLVTAATGVSLLTGFFGVGGGFAIVPTLVLVLGFTMPTAIGTSLLVISINTASAFFARFGSGLELDWVVIGAFSGFAIAGSLLGARIARRSDPSRLTTAFTILLVVIAGYIAATTIPALLG